MSSNQKPYVVIVFQGAVINRVIKNYPDAVIGEDFFASALWEDRPNSTSRLNIVNYQALSRLQDKYCIEFLCVSEISPWVERRFRRADIIVVNQVASPVSRRFLASFVDWMDVNSIDAKVIFGTEFTWFRELAAGTITRSMLDRVYFQSLLLRHTARTDVTLYDDESCHKAVIQEFELGIDTDVVRGGPPASQRGIISFVRAPEGRTTKNNDAIDRIIGLIKQSGILSRFDIRVIEPPYSSLDYWQLMRDSAFLVFTSLGETFSYCLNDAKSAGAVTLFPAQMYYSCVGLSMAVDSYPDSGIRYTSDDQLIRTLERLAASPDAMDKAGSASRRFVCENFSIDAVARNWDLLFSGENSNTQHLYLYDPALHESWKSVAGACRELGARYAMPYLNAEIPDSADEMLTWYDEDHDVVMVRYNLCQGIGGKTHSILSQEGAEVRVGKAGDRLDTEEAAARYLQLVCRTYKVSTLTLDASLSNTPPGIGAGKVRCFAGLAQGLVPLTVHTRPVA